MPARTRTALAALTSATWLAVPATAAAHSLAGDRDPGRPVLEYVWLGFRHMVGGWDHLLFIAGVILLAGGWRLAAKLVSLFVAGHSLTLLVASLAGWRVDPTVVDVVIALSLVSVGAAGLRGRPLDARVTGAVVFAFGLAHGLGLSTRLQTLGLPEGGLVGRILLFNLGVELGQLTALAVVAGLGAPAVRGIRRHRARATRLAFGALAAAGLVAAAILSLPGDGRGVPSASACREAAFDSPGSPTDEHPPKNFFAPGETADADQLGHALDDGAVIIHYRAGLPAADVRAVERFVARTPAVLAVPSPSQREAVKALAVFKSLSCTTLDTAALKTFSDTRFTVAS